MKNYLVALLIVTAMAVSAQTKEVSKVRITSDRVSIRSKPDVNSELLDRAMRGEEFVLLGETNEWMAVQTPDSLNFWVSSEYIQNGIVVPEKLNVRSGPNQNYSVVCVVNKGDSVSLRGELNKWLKIAPPSGSHVWISKKYIEMVTPPNPVVKPKPRPVVKSKPVVKPKPRPVVKSKPVVKPKPRPVVKSKPVVKPKPAMESGIRKEDLKPLELVLDKNREQGVHDEIFGVLRRANLGLYKLVLIVGDLEEPICLVRGNEAQMERYLNRLMLIKGKKYWAKDVKIPIIRTEKINLNPFN